VEMDLLESAKQTHKWSIKILNMSTLILIGMCLPNSAAINKYDNADLSESNPGHYMICSRGWTYFNSGVGTSNK
jgi:hypothetical protein